MDRGERAGHPSKPRPSGSQVASPLPCESPLWANSVPREGESTRRRLMEGGSTGGGSGKHNLGTITFSPG